MYWRLDGHDVVAVDDAVEWAISFEGQDRHVGLTEFEGLEVSTVFLGLNHSYGDGPPILFETMIFRTSAPGKWVSNAEWEGWTRRYATWDEAEQGHAEALAEIEKIVELAMGTDDSRRGTMDPRPDRPRRG